MMDLKDVRDKQKLESTQRLVKSAHDQGVEKVFVWDHALYDLDYYPDEFKTSDGLIDLDDVRRARDLQHKITSGWDLYDNRKFDFK